MAKQDESKSTQNPQTKRGFFSATKSYLFEYAILQVLSASLSIILFIAIYTIFSVASGRNLSSSSTGMLAFVLGFLIVLAPVTITLYARTSAEENLHPARIKQTLRRVIYFISFGAGLASAVIFSVVAGYSAIRVLFGLEAAKNLVSVALPSLIIVLLHVYYLSLVLRHAPISLKLRRFNIIFQILLAVVLSILILIIAASNKENISQDRSTVSNLLTTSKLINEQYTKTGSLPDSFNDIQNLDQSIKASFSNQTYVYKPILSNGYDEPVQPLLDSNSDSTSSSSDLAIGKASGGYQLCATFQTSSNGSSQDEYIESSTVDYSGYSSYYTDSIVNHSSGYQCFDLYPY